MLSGDGLAEEANDLRPDASTPVRFGGPYVNKVRVANAIREDAPISDDQIFVIRKHVQVAPQCGFFVFFRSPSIAESVVHKSRLESNPIHGAQGVTYVFGTFCYPCVRYGQ